jgi:predicted phosphodiesterase
VSILVIADVHGNLPAFEAVLEQARRQADIEAIWCLGDTVGYGPQPGECLALLRSFPHHAIAGNHDLAAVGMMSTEDFNAAATVAARWTMEHLTPDERAYIEALPLTITDGDFTLVHGSLVDPVWDYLVSDEVASGHLAMQKTPFGLVGHSHIALAFYEDGRKGRLPDGLRLQLEGSKFVANPGSLGQPRDGDSRAAYALVDLPQRTVTFLRAEYDIEVTRNRIFDAGLPRSLGDRLLHGR